MEISVSNQGQYSDGTYDYTVKFVFDYAVVTVSVNPDDDYADDEPVIEMAREVLAHQGIALP
jgi:hypothetical protein